MIKLSANIESSNSFYDTLAEDYNNYMTDADNEVRKVVSETFNEFITAGNVLDFGGGTGLDLPWLLQCKYQVFFLEPSAQMRSIAMETILTSSNNKRPKVIEDKTNLKEWSIGNLPFTEKMDGVLANFAVINCIENAEEFFHSIALLCKPGCKVVLTVLDPRPQAIFKKNSIFCSIQMLLKGKFKVLHNYKGVYHETHIHSIDSLKKASRKYFDLIFHRPVKSSGFIILIFSKK